MLLKHTPKDVAKRAEEKRAVSRKVDAMVRPAMDGLTKKTDDVFVEAVNRAIGKGWTIAELKGRCESIKRQGDSFEVIHLDGTPILELHDIETTTDFSEMKSTIAWKRDYRFLIPSNTKHEPTRD